MHYICKTNFPYRLFKEKFKLLSTRKKLKKSVSNGFENMQLRYTEYMIL